MQQHPVPQNVTQYQFRLVGDMTLKQFLELAGGLLLAYLFFASNLIFIFKWPLVLLSVLVGVGLAFFPIEDRPLDTWVTNFLKSIYGPTRFIWKKTNKTPSFFLFATTPAVTTNTVTKTIKAPAPMAPPAPTSDLSADESAHLSSLDALFQVVPPSSSPTVTRESLTISHKPTVSIRKLHATPTIDLNFRPQSTPSLHIESPQATRESALQVGDVRNASQGDTPDVQQSGGPDSVVFQAPSIHADTPVASSTPTPTVTLPATPKLPNLVTGVVVDPIGKLVDSAIVQIVDTTGVPARALKTNSLGRFFTSTPLTPGQYTIEVDKMGLRFTPQSLTVNDSVLPAIELRATQ